MRIAVPLLALLPLTLPVPASAASLFDSHTALDIEISGPLSTLVEDRKSREELPFRLRVGGVAHDIEVRIRGKSRLRVCDFVPMRLDFPDDVPADSPFAGQDKLKLVTHCRDTDRAEADLLQEYLAYRIFNLLSDVSFRVRLVQMTYLDGDEPEKTPLSRHAFLIESIESVAARTGGRVVEPAGVALAHLDDRQAALVYIFQYLIGNTDWSLVAADGEEACCHNAKLVEAGEKLFYVPYDFDLAGLVNARYARPDPSLRISRVTTRRYRGFCTDRTVLESALAEVRAQRDAVVAIVEALPDPEGRVIAPAARYLDGFFDEAGNPERLLASFERRCL